MTTAVSPKEMIVELEGVQKRMQELAAKAKEGTFAAEDRKSFDGLHTRAEEIQAEIKTAQEDQARIADMKGLDEFLNSPQYKVRHGIDGTGGHEAGDKKALMRAGWEVKNGIVCAPVSYKGQMVEMYPESVLFGDIPTDDPDSAQYFKATRASFQPEYRAAFIKWMKVSAKSGVSEAIAWSKMSGAEQKALSEGTDTAGGFLVPPDAQSEILARKRDRAIMRTMGGMQITTSRDLVSWPRLQAKTTEGSIYSDGFVGDWAGETPAFTDVDAAFGQMQIAIKKVRAVTKLANDFISDAITNPLTLLSVNGAANMALTEDKGFIVGTGAPLQPTGITVGTAAGNQTNTAGTTANTISNTIAAPLVSPAALINLVYSLPPQYWPNAKMLLAPLTERNIRKLVDAQGRFLFLPYTGGSFASTPGQRDIEGYPVGLSQFMPADGVSGNINIAFGDFSSYIIADRAQISVVILRERFADTDQTGIILWGRVGGALWNDDGMRFGLAG